MIATSALDRFSSSIRIKKSYLCMFRHVPYWFFFAIFCLNRSGSFYIHTSIPELPFKSLVTAQNLFPSPWNGKTLKQTALSFLCNFTVYCFSVIQRILTHTMSNFWFILKGYYPFFREVPIMEFFPGSTLLVSPENTNSAFNQDAQCWLKNHHFSISQASCIWNAALM